MEKTREIFLMKKSGKIRKNCQSHNFLIVEANVLENIYITFLFPYFVLKIKIYLYDKDKSELDSLSVTGHFRQRHLMELLIVHSSLKSSAPFLHITPSLPALGDVYLHMVM